MSLSNSRWAQQETKNATPKNGNDRKEKQQDIREKKPSSSNPRYIPPNLRPKPSHQPPSSSIIINPSDRKLSKKFSSPQPPLHNDQSKLAGLINSFDSSTQLDPRPDPMSLVPSPSRGIIKRDPSNQSSSNMRSEITTSSSPYQEQDLTDFRFQNEFFKWFLIKKFKPYRKRYPNPIKLYLQISLKEYKLNHEENDNTNLNEPRQNGVKANRNINTDHSSTLVNQNEFSSQVDQVSSLVREIRKLREGILAGGRRDSFAILVYELSAELALESLDFPQLNTSLSVLIFDLYKNVPMSEHRLLDETNIDLLASSSQTKEGEEASKEIESILNENQSTQEEILDRRLMFSSVLLLLPIVTRFDLSTFLTQSSQICQIFDNGHHHPVNSGQREASTSTGTDCSGFSTLNHPKLLELGDLFKLLLRKNYAHINRKLIKPKLKKIATNNNQAVIDSPQKSVQWDDLLYLNLLNLIRSKLIWKSMEKSYYHLNLNDDPFIFDSLCLEFLYLDQFFNNSDNHGVCLLNVHQSVDHWLSIVNIQRNTNGTIPFKK